MMMSLSRYKTLLSFWLSRSVGDLVSQSISQSVSDVLILASSDHCRAVVDTKTLDKLRHRIMTLWVND